MEPDVEEANLKALVTGSPDRVSAVAAALQARGCEVVTVDAPDTLPAVCASLGENAIDMYIQLPVNVPSRGDSVVARLRAFLAGGLLTRVDDAATVLGTLRPNASVVLVAGNLPAELTAPDDRQARISLMKVLLQAIRADTAPVPVRGVVVEHRRTPEEIAEIALDPAANRLSKIADLAERYPEMDYADWRLAVLGLASIES
jgi:hypothetical protein